MGRSDSLQAVGDRAAVSKRLLAVSGLLVALLALHHATFASMVQSWIDNTTYSHGFVIPLIALYFAWQRRHQAEKVQGRVWWPGFVFVAGLSLLWTVATAVSVQVVAQLASVALISALVLALAGPALALVFALPLVYLLFAVPFGEGIVPLLMEWTADFTVGALHLVGIPVIRDGLYFSIPSGNFEVAEACSGVRYLLASAAAGVAFAFLTYNGWKKRLIFIMAALIVPLVANGLRAFGIVLIAHYSDLKLATGVDHFIYGWFFFGVIILALFLVGARYADQQVEPRLPSAATAFDGAGLSSEGSAALVAASLIALVLLAAGPALIEYRSVAAHKPRIALADASSLPGRWTGPLAPDERWQLAYHGAADELAAAYRHGADDQRIEVRVAAYGVQSQGAELINAVNRIAGPEGWRLTNLGTISTPSEAVPKVRAVRASRDGRNYLIWYWYQQGTTPTTSNYEAKLLEMLAIPNPSPASIVALGIVESGGNAEDALREFVSTLGDPLRYCVAGSAAQDRCLVPDSPRFRP